MGLCMNRLILCMEVLAISFFYLHKVFKLPLFADVCIIGVNVYRQWGPHNVGQCANSTFYRLVGQAETQPNLLLTRNKILASIS